MTDRSKLQKNTQNASKLTILRSEIEKFSGEGALPPPQTPPQ